jgi:hypothetical protein
MNLGASVNLFSLSQRLKKGVCLQKTNTSVSAFEGVAQCSHRCRHNIQD